MKVYDELRESMQETVGNINETPEYKQRFIKLIENYFDQSYTDQDISDLIHMAEDVIDGD